MISSLAPGSRLLLFTADAEMGSKGPSDKRNLQFKLADAPQFQLDFGDLASSFCPRPKRVLFATRATDMEMHQSV